MPAPDGVFALVFTSANAVRAFAAADDNRQVRAYCVGAATAQAATAAGYRSVSADGDSDDLLELVTAHHSSVDLPYLYLLGD